jgi:inosine-uridine nucleoside N-ribohydrolase
MKIKNNITEKKLTKSELEVREKVIKDLKKNKSSLVKRYGKDAEAVMYGRATNIAKKMAESENKNRIKELVKKSLMSED